MTKSSQLLTNISDNFGAADVLGVEPGLSVFLIVGTIIAMFLYGALSHICKTEEQSHDH